MELSFKTRETVDKYLHNETEQTPFALSRCNNSYRNKRGRTRIRIGLYPCEQCTQDYKHTYNLYHGCNNTAKAQPTGHAVYEQPTNQYTYRSTN